MADTEALSADQLDLLRRRILNVTGHALRTPVSAVRGLAEALAAGGVDQAPDPEVLAALHHSAARLEALVDDILLATGVTTAVPVGPPQSVDIVSAVAHEWPLDASKPDVSGTAVALVVPEAATKVAHHVATNTARYLDPPYAVRGSATDGRVTVEVEGMGHGPSDDELDLVFEPLFRGEHAVMAASGIGLGLPVSRTLLTSVGGTISLTRAGERMVTRIEVPSP